MAIINKHINSQFVICNKGCEGYEINRRSNGLAISTFRRFCNKFRPVQRTSSVHFQTPRFPSNHTQHVPWIVINPPNIKKHIMRTDFQFTDGIVTMSRQYTWFRMSYLICDLNVMVSRLPPERSMHETRKPYWCWWWSDCVHSIIILRPLYESWLINADYSRPQDVTER